MFTLISICDIIESVLEKDTVEKETVVCSKESNCISEKERTNVGKSEWNLRGEY